jgi:hypothetical protein
MVRSRVWNGYPGSIMKKSAYFLTALMTVAAATTLSMNTGCSKKGPAEKAGESLDKAGENVKDAVTPDGPVEKAGKKVDKAVDRATD